MAQAPSLGVLVTYDEIEKLIDSQRNVMYQGARKLKGRDHLDIGSLESVILWVAKHGRPSLRLQICGRAAESLLKDGIIPGEKRRRRA